MYSLLMKNERFIRREREQKRKANELNKAHPRPNFFKGKWTEEEDAKIIKLQALYGNRWAKILPFLPGRSKRSIRNRCSSIKSATGSKTGRTKVTVSKLSQAPKLIAVGEDDSYSSLMSPISAMQDPCNLKVEVTKPPYVSCIQSNTKKTSSLCEKSKKRGATIESCLASKHRVQKTEDIWQQRPNRMNDLKSKRSSFLAEGFADKRVYNNVLLIDTLNNDNTATLKGPIDVFNQIKSIQSKDLASLDYSAGRVYGLEENAFMEMSSEEIPYYSNDATSTNTQHKEGNETSSFDPNSLAYAISYATSLINA
jgi:hypothetical protein